MDCGSEYIKMCERAVEVQKLCPIKLLGHHYRFDNRIHILRGEYYYWHIEVENENEKVWLPRQDQLQGILEIGDKLLAGIDWLGNFCEEYGNNFTSMEQLWLAFVMKEKYKKIWKVSEWVRV